MVKLQCGQGTIGCGGGGTYVGVGVGIYHGRHIQWISSIWKVSGHRQFGGVPIQM